MARLVLDDVVEAAAGRVEALAKLDRSPASGCRGGS
jgi:hypothetical protein